MFDHSHVAMRPCYNAPMTRERDRATENPYASPCQVLADNIVRRKRQSLPWWARPPVPNIMGALSMGFVLIVAVVVGLLLPFIQWLTR